MQGSTKKIPVNRDIKIYVINLYKTQDPDLGRANHLARVDQAGKLQLFRTPGQPEINRVQ
jgi:hypothetical protein